MIIPVILPLIDQGWGLEKVAMEVMIKIMNINMADN